MKKVLKNNAKLFIGIIIGILVSGIIVSGIIVSAATILFSSDAVEFTPTDGNFKVNDVETALNELYDYHKYIDEMSTSDIVMGSFTNKTTSQAINVGFKPSKLILYLPKLNDNSKRLVFYDKSISENDSIWIRYTNSSSTTVTVRDLNTITLTDTGFTFYMNDSTWSVKTYYYAIK